MYSQLDCLQDLHWADQSETFKSSGNLWQALKHSNLFHKVFLKSVVHEPVAQSVMIDKSIAIHVKDLSVQFKNDVNRFGSCLKVRLMARWWPGRCIALRIKPSRWWALTWMLSKESSFCFLVQAPPARWVQSSPAFKLRFSSFWISTLGCFRRHSCYRWSAKPDVHLISIFWTTATFTCRKSRGYFEEPFWETFSSRTHMTKLRWKKSWKRAVSTE